MLLIEVNSVDCLRRFAVKRASEMPTFRRYALLSSYSVVEVPHNTWSGTHRHFGGLGSSSLRNFVSQIMSFKRCVYRCCDYLTVPFSKPLVLHFWRHQTKWIRASLSGNSLKYRASLRITQGVRSLSAVAWSDLLHHIHKGDPDRVHNVQADWNGIFSKIIQCLALEFLVFPVAWL